MPRAKRFYLPGHLYHITHRCHNRRFLLKTPYEKHRWKYWLTRSIGKYGLKILTYCATDNHIHLVVHPEDGRDVIARSMQLTAGQVAREYNERKDRGGAFWEDRYHATAVQPGAHLLRCMVYVDLNMVRAGVVRHPGDWPHCGYAMMNESSSADSFIDKACLVSSLNLNSWDEFMDLYRRRLEDAPARDELQREPRWTKSIAVGDRAFVESVKSLLSHRAKSRKVVSEGDDESLCMLQEPTISYQENSPNEYLWLEDNLIPWNTMECSLPGDDGSHKSL